MPFNIGANTEIRANRPRPGVGRRKPGFKLCMKKLKILLLADAENVDGGRAGQRHEAAMSELEEGRVSHWGPGPHPSREAGHPPTKRPAPKPGAARSSPGTGPVLRTSQRRGGRQNKRHRLSACPSVRAGSAGFGVRLAQAHVGRGHECVLYTRARPPLFRVIALGEGGSVHPTTAALSLSI